MVVQCILAALAALAVVVVAAMVFRRSGRDDPSPDGATASHAGAMISALFLLVLAIAIIVPWTSADTAKANTAAEAQAVTEAYWTVGSLPDPTRQTVRSRLRAYLSFVADTEWRHMRDDGELDQGWEDLDTIRGELMALSPASDEIKDTKESAIARVADIYAARRQRETETGDTLPNLILVILVLTGVLVVLFPFLAGARPRRMTLVALGAMAALLGAGIYLVFDINGVFDGPLKVGPDAYRTALGELGRISSGR